MAISSRQAKNNVFSYFVQGIKNVELVQLVRLLIEALETALPDKRTEYKPH